MGQSSADVHGSEHTRAAPTAFLPPPRRLAGLGKHWSSDWQSAVVRQGDRKPGGGREEHPVIAAATTHARIRRSNIALAYCMAPRSRGEHSPRRCILGREVDHHPPPPRVGLKARDLLLQLAVGPPPQPRVERLPVGYPSRFASRCLPLFARSPPFAGTRCADERHARCSATAP